MTPSLKEKVTGERDIENTKKSNPHVWKIRSKKFVIHPSASFRRRDGIA